MNSIRCKRIYAPYDINDGVRILVDRLWPRGISKEIARIDLWAKSIAPSTELRKWFSHDAQRFEEFGIRYRIELDNNPEANEFLSKIRSFDAPITLVYGAKDIVHNHANVLKAWIEDNYEFKIE